MAASQNKNKEYKNLFNHFPSHLIVLDSNGSVLVSSETFRKLTKYTNKDLEAKKITSLKLFKTKSGSNVIKKIKRILAGKLPKFGELGAIEIVTKSKKKLTVAVNYNLVKSQDKKELIVTFDDVTGCTNLKEDVKTSEALLKDIGALFEKNITGIIIIQNGKIVYGTDYVRNFLGKDYLGKPFVKFIAPEYRVKVMKLYAARLLGRKIPPTYDIKMLFKGPMKDKILDVEIASTLINYKGKKAIMAFAHDITAKKRVEKEIKESEKKYKILADNIDTGLILHGADTKLLFSNLAASKILGLSVDQMQGKIAIDSSWKFVREDGTDMPLTEYPVNKVVSSKKAFKNYIVGIRRKDRKYITWVNVDATPVLVDKALDYVSITFVDITTKKELEKERVEYLVNISKQKNELNTILDNIAEGVFAIDKDNNITLFNEFAAQIFRHSPKTVIGKKYGRFLKFVYQDELVENNLIEEAIGKLKKSDQATLRMDAFNITLVNKMGHKIPVVFDIAELKDEQGELFGYIVTFRDITKFTTIDKLKSEFVSIASHQLRTPLSGIRWFAELLLKQKTSKLDKTQVSYAQQIYDSNKRIISLVDDLLDVSHIDSDEKFGIKKAKTDLYVVVKSVLDDIDHLIKEKGVKVVFKGCTPKKDVLFIDKAKMIQVLYNLLSNAVKYSKRGGIVEISCSKEQRDSYMFCIKDDGIGIPKYQHKQVFTKFFRADNVGLKDREGTGLGLYIARAIIEAHGGNISFDSKEGKGSTFCFTLPKGK